MNKLKQRHNKMLFMSLLKYFFYKQKLSKANFIRLLKVNNGIFVLN